MPYVRDSESSRASSLVTDNVQDVAVIGLACRFGGEATDAEHFWDFLCDARCTLPSNFQV